MARTNEREVEKVALKQLLLTKQIEGLRSKLEALIAKDKDFESRKAALVTREAELEAAVAEVTDETTDEERAAVDEAVAGYEAEQEALETEQGEHDEAKTNLEGEIKKLSDELEEINKKAAPKPEARKNESEVKLVETRVKFFGMGKDERDAFFSREDIKAFLGEVRSIKTRGVTNGSLLIVS